MVARPDWNEAAAVERLCLCLWFCFGFVSFDGSGKGRGLVWFGRGAGPWAGSREGPTLLVASTHVNQILPSVKLAHNNLLHVLQASHADVQLSRDELVRVVGKEAVEESGQHVDHLVVSVEHAQRPAPNGLGHLEHLLQAVAQGQVHQVVGGYQAARGGAGNAVHALAGDVLFPAVDDAEVVAACWGWGVAVSGPSGFGLRVARAERRGANSTGGRPNLPINPAPERDRSISLSSPSYSL